MSASTLAQRQREIQARLLGSGRDPQGIVLGDARLSAAQRLDIYADAYRARLCEALVADFGALHAYLGDEQFERLAHAYLEAFPSRHFSLRGFGENLSTFLRERSPYAQHPELCELARFEWALCAAFDAADAAPAVAAGLAAVAPDGWGELRFDFHPSMRCIALRGNIPALWSALCEKQTPPALRLEQAATVWLIWRRDLKLLFRPLDAPEAAALEGLREGESFARLCERLSEIIDEAQVPQRAAGFLRQWLDDGLIVRWRA